MESKIYPVTKIRQWETMAVFALLFLFLGVKFQRQVFYYLAMGFLLIALLVPPLARLLTQAWSHFSLLLAKVNNRIILTIIFYVVLTPLACLYRLFHKDPLRLGMKESDSYYSDRNHTYASVDLEKMW